MCRFLGYEPLRTTEEEVALWVVVGGEGDGGENLHRNERKTPPID